MAMRIFRFLQVHPHWLYKLAAGLVVIAFVLTEIYGWGKRSEVMIYPLILFVLPTSIYGLVSIALLASLGEVIIDLTRQPPRGSVFSHLGLAFVITVAFSLGLALFGPGLPELEHVSTVQYDDHIYNLARENLFSITGWSTSSTHIFYKCDSLGVICRPLHRESLLVSTLRWDARGASRIYEARVELSANPDRNTISILVDGEMVYRYRLDE
jgi:hypothetical protein